MESAGNGGCDSSNKECRIDIVPAQCAGGTVAFAYPADANPPPNGIPKSKNHQSAAAPVAVTRTRAGCAVPVTIKYTGAAPDHSRSSTRICTLRECIYFCGILQALLWLVGGLYMFILAMKDLHHDLHPTFRVKDFAVSNFSISDHGLTMLAATWEAKLSMINQHRKHTVYLQTIQSIFSYHGGSIIKRLYQRMMDPLLLEETSKASITIRVTTNTVRSQWENICWKLQDTGTMRLGLGIHLKEAFDCQHRYYPFGQAATIFCPGLQVTFRLAGNTGFGTLSTDNPSREVSCWVSFAPYGRKRSQNLPIVEADTFFLFGEIGAES